MTHSKRHSPPPPVAASRASRRRSHRDGFTRVMRELEEASATGPHMGPILERLKQCPEAFTAGEMVGKIFNALKYGEDEDDERYLPPAGVVMPLV